VTVALGLLGSTIGPSAAQESPEEPPTTTTTSTATTAPTTTTTTLPPETSVPPTTDPPSSDPSAPPVVEPPPPPPAPPVVLAPPQQAVLDELRADYDHDPADLDFLTRLLGAQSLVTNLELELVNLDLSLGTVNGELADAQARVDAADRALAATRREQAAVDDDLAVANGLLRAWAVEAYIAGGVEPPAGAVLGARTPAEMGMTSTYADALVVDQNRAIAVVRRLQADFAELEAVRRSQQAAAVAARDDVELRQLELLEQRAQYDRAMAAAQLAIAEEQGLLAETEERRAAYEQRLIEANRVSDGISERLRLAQAGQAPPILTTAIFLPPLRGLRVSSNFGPRIHPIYGVSRMHNGIDFTAPTGTPIRASLDGTVLIAGPQGGYGNTVVIDHGNGVGTLYAHMSAITVAEGDVVRTGDVIGAVGSTGQSTGPHLHWEVRRDGQPVNPLPYLGPDR
jgi:murein DD-endopeptidase MepM/ murein hydrolase activator NlpD